MNKKSIIFGICIFFLLLGLTQGVRAELLTDLDAYYKLDTSSGSILVNEVGTNGTLNSAYWDCGVKKLGACALDYSQNTDQIDTNIITNTEEDFTISFWANIYNSATTIRRFPFSNSVLNEGVTIGKGSTSGNAYYVSIGVGTSRETSNTFDPAQNMNFYVLRKKGKLFELFENNNIVINKTTTGDPASSGVDWKLARDTDASANTPHGYFDEIGIWSRYLSYDEMEDLYNNSYGLPFANFNVAPFIITAEDKETSGAIATFNATIDGTTYFTTNGTINTGLNSTLGIKTITVRANQHFNKIYTDYDLSTNLVADLLEWPRITAYDKEDGQTISVFNVSSSGVVYLPSAGVVYFPFNSLKTITISAGGYFSNTTTFNFTGSNDLNASLFMEYARMQIKAYKSPANIVPILNFSVSAYSLNSSFTNIDSTTNGTLNVMYPRNELINMTINNSFYEIKTAIFTPTYKQVYNFSLFTTNSISFTINDESTGNLINELIYITIIGTGSSYNLNTTNGTAYKDNLPDGEYTIKFWGGNYTIRYYSVSVADRSHQYLTSYLAKNTETTIFTIFDRQTNQKLESVSFTMHKLINGSWTTIFNHLSDVAGNVQVAYIPDEAYKFTLSKDGYITKTFDLNPVLFSTYSVSLNPSQVSNSLGNDISVSYYPIVFQTGNNSFLWSISSPKGNLNNYWLNVSYPGGSDYFSGVNSIGSTFTTDFWITNPQIFDNVVINYHYESIDGDNRTIKSVYSILLNSTGDGTFYKQQGQTYGMGIFTRMVLITFVALILAGTSFLIAGPIGAVAIVLLIFGFAVKIGFIPLWSAIIPFLIGIVLVIKGGST